MNELKDYHKELFEGERINLRATTEADKELFAKWWNTEEVGLGNRSCVFPSYESSNRELMDNWARNAGRDGFGMTIETKDHEAIGLLTVFNLTLPAMIATVGIFLGPEYQGQGFGKEAMKKAVDISFRELNAHKVEVNVHSYNERAIRLYEEVGFIHEGCRRAVTYHNGTYYDSITMGILREEYEMK